MPEPGQPAQTLAARTLELLWQDDASAYALVRDSGGRFSADGLDLGEPAAAELAGTGRVDVRRVELGELLELSTDPPDGVELGGTARVALAVLDVARRSVAAGLVHPHLEAADGRWHALWGATIDEHVREELDAIAHAAPAVSAEAFDGVVDAFVDDLYGCAVDELARGALRAGGIRLTADSPRLGIAGDDSCRRDDKRL